MSKLLGHINASPGQHTPYPLGLRLGNIITHSQQVEGLMGLTTDHAFSLALEDCFPGARIVSMLELTLLERSLLLKIWVLHVIPRYTLENPISF